MPRGAIGSRTNWAGNLTYGADRYVAPRTISEVQEVVRSADKIRAVGSRHCFNDIADTNGAQVSLEHMNSILALDRTRRRVTVEGGIRYGELGAYLHGEGYALHNLASLPHISVAGACATATHGSGGHGNLATAVVEVEIIDGRGDQINLSRETDGDTFAGAVVNLGALGIVSKLTLTIEPAFNIRQDVYRDLPFAALESRFEEIMASGYSVSLFTSWRGDFVEQAWIKSLAKGDEGFLVRDSLFGARPARTNMHPINLDAVNCTAQLGVPGPAYDRLPHFRMGFTPASGDELQVEYYVPIEHAIPAIRALREQGLMMADLLLVGEIRTIGADDLWLSPCYQTPCVAFHFSFKQDWSRLKTILLSLESALAPMHPRPHWGKLFAASAESIQACYPRLVDFRELRRLRDPDNKFCNAFIERRLL